MFEFAAKVTAVRMDTLGSETTSALVATDTVIPLVDSGDFDESGGSVLIAGEVYTYSELDEGDESGIPSITLDAPGLSDAVDAETRVDSWNPSANNGAGAVEVEWVADVVEEGPDVDGGAGEATVDHALIPLVGSGMPLDVGKSVAVRDDGNGEWTVVNVRGERAAMDPGFIRTGGLGADTVVWAGTENGRRAQLDGIDGAIEAFNDANEQTVNIDGEQNFIEGTLATAATGARVEVGQGELFDLPAEEVRFHSGSPQEVGPGSVSVFVNPITGGVDLGFLAIRAPEWDGVSERAHVWIVTGSPSGDGGPTPSEVQLRGDVITLDGDVSVFGSHLLNATMAAGSVGTGTFRDSVDARVTAVGGAAYQPLDGDLTAVAALTPSNDDVIQRKAGAWTNRTMTQVKTDLALVKGDVGLGSVDNTSDAAKPVSTATQTALDLKANLRRTINTQTGTSYTLVLTDEFKVIQVSNAATHTLTVPPNASVAFPTGSEIEVVRLGGGAVTIAAGAGVTITSRSGLLSINGQYGTVRLRKRAADIWHLSGDLV